MDSMLKDFNATVSQSNNSTVTLKDGTSFSVVSTYTVGQSHAVIVGAALHIQLITSLISTGSRRRILRFSDRRGWVVIRYCRAY